MTCGSGRLAGFALGLLVTMSVAPVSAAPAAGLGPETAVGEPANGYVGRLDVSPEHAPAGTPVTVMAEHLPPGQEFQLIWVTAIGTWKVTDTEYHGREFTPVAYEIARVRTDSSGRFAANFTAPDDYGFMHDIVLQQGSRLFTKVGFNLDMTVEISPESGPVGTQGCSTLL